MPQQVQDHIHLGVTLGAAPENAPIYKFFVTAYDTDPGGFWSVDYGLSGKPLIYVLKDGGGDPVTFENYRASLYLTDGEFGFTIRERVAQVKSMRGRFVYLVQHDHADDGEDHTPQVRYMFCDDVKGEEPVDVMITRIEIKITLIDAEMLA